MPGNVDCSAALQRVEMRPIEFAGPLVHERLLEFDRNRAGLARKRGVNPSRKVAAEELHVLAHVERPAGEVERPQVGDEAVDHRPPRRAVDAAGADVDLGILCRVRRAALARRGNGCSCAGRARRRDRTGG